MKRSEELRTQAKHVASFRDAYMQLLSLSRIVHDEIYFTHRLRVPKEGMDGDYYRHFRQVARNAGQAVVGPAGAIREIANWKQSFEDVEVLSAKDVLESCESMTGMLEEQARVFEKRDRSFAGRLAAFVGFPSRVQAIVAQDHPQLQRAAFGVGITGQVLVGVLVTVLGAGALALVVALWNTVI